MRDAIIGALSPDSTDRVGINGGQIQIRQTNSDSADKRARQRASVKMAPVGKLSTDSLKDASGLLLAITASDFTSALFVTNKCLG